MTQRFDQRTWWTSADLELLPDDGKRYEIIDGELLVSRQPHFEHQHTCLAVGVALDVWSSRTGLGRAVIAPGMVFGDYDDVVPDVAWVATDRLPSLLDEAGHLTGAPDLAVEVLSDGPGNVRRDRELKRKVYDVRGVREYWIVDWREREVEVLCRTEGWLALVATLRADDTLTSPLLPGFAVAVRDFFA